MRILVLTPYLPGTAPGPRSSIELWERVLEPAGIHFEYAAFESPRLHEIIYEPGRVVAKAMEMTRAYARQARRALSAVDYDAVLVYREAALVGPALLERLVARRGVPIIYQLDDPLYVPYRSPSNGYFSYLKFFGKVAAICRLSTTVIVNSPQHRAYARAHNTNVHEIPSVVDGETFRSRRLRPRGTDSPVRVGWSGSATTVANLKVIHSLLRELSARDDVELRILGTSTLDLPGVEAVCTPWSAEREVPEMSTFDVGLLPLPVDNWTRRKFYLKLVQYMALGIPAVCSPLGANPDVVEDGATGYLASDEAAWRDRVLALVEQPQLRWRLGERATSVAHARYTLEANAERILSAVRSAVDR